MKRISVCSGLIFLIFLCRCTPVVREYKDLKSKDYSRHFVSGQLPVYSGDSLRQIGFPAGGLGQGYLLFGGRGNCPAFVIPGASQNAAPDLFFFSIRALEDSEFNSVETVEFEPVTKLLEGSLHPDEHQEGDGVQLQAGIQLQEGIPRCSQASFTNQYPFGNWRLEDPDLPVEAALEVFSPLIPTDLYNSSLPLSYLTWKIRNPLEKKVSISLALATTSPFEHSDFQSTPFASPMQGIVFDEDHKGLILSSGRAECCIVTGAQTKISMIGGAGSFHNLLHRFWFSFHATGRVGRPETGHEYLRQKKGQLAVFQIEKEMGPGEELEVPFIIAWNPEPEYLRKSLEIPLNTLGLAAYGIREREMLNTKTRAFAQLIGSSSYPEEVIEAMLSSFSQLKHGDLQEDWIYSPLPVWMFPEIGKELSAHYLKQAEQSEDTRQADTYAGILMSCLASQLDTSGVEMPDLRALRNPETVDMNAQTTILMMAARHAAELNTGLQHDGTGPEALEDLYWNGEFYSMAEGGECHSDHLLGQSMVWNIGLDSLLPRKRIQRSLQSVYRYNFRSSWSAFLNVGPAGVRNREGGLIQSAWPYGDEPEIPLPAADEVWSGPEYSLAGMMIRSGMLDEAMEIIRASRKRFRGFNRNPLALHHGDPHLNRAAWEIHLALSGHHYNAGKKLLSFHPRINQENFVCPWTSGNGWGSIKLTGASLELEVLHGWLSLEQIELPIDYGFTGLLESSHGLPAVERSGNQILILLESGTRFYEGDVLSLEFRK